MNKTVNCNLAGIVFHMDEDAFAKLNAYINTIRKYFEGSEGRDEIIADIEARFAELFQEKLSKTKEVIGLKEVEEVIAIMGEPEAYLDEAEEPMNSSGSSQSTNKGGKRIFRNPDDSVIGGVCGGLAAYFGVDPLIFRLAFLILFFGFGTGLILYILLWIVIPEAKTAAEKLQMRGEPVNASNIGKVINEEFQSVKSKVSDSAQKFGNKENREEIKHGIEKVFDGIWQIITFIFKFIFKIIGAALIILGVVITLSLLSSFFGFGFAFLPFYDAHPMAAADLEVLAQSFFLNERQITWIFIGLAGFALVPILHLIYFGLQLIFKTQSMPRALSIGLGSIWFISLLILAGNLIALASDFRSYASYTQEIEIQSDSASTLFLDLDESLFDEEEYELFYEEYENLLVSNQVELDVKKGFGNYPMLRVKHKARGRSRLAARANAKTLNYTFTQTDSLLTFNDYFTLDAKDKWRFQEVELDLLIPVGHEVVLHDEMVKIIYDIDNVHNMWDHDMVNHRWKMTDEGLRCMDCINP